MQFELCMTYRICMDDKCIHLNGIRICCWMSNSRITQHVFISNHVNKNKVIKNKYIGRHLSSLTIRRVCWRLEVYPMGTFVLNNNLTFSSGRRIHATSTNYLLVTPKHFITYFITYMIKSKGKPIRNVMIANRPHYLRPITTLVINVINKPITVFDWIKGRVNIYLSPFHSDIRYLYWFRV